MGVKTGPSELNELMEDKRPSQGEAPTECFINAVVGLRSVVGRPRLPGYDDACKLHFTNDNDICPLRWTNGLSPD